MAKRGRGAMNATLQSALGGASAVLLDRFLTQPTVGRFGLPEDIGKIVIGGALMMLPVPKFVKTAGGALAVIGGSEMVNRIGFGSTSPTVSSGGTVL